MEGYSGNTFYYSAYLVGGSLTSSSYQDLVTEKTVFTALGSIPVSGSGTIQWLELILSFY